MGETNYWQGKCNADALLPAANILSKLAPKLSDEQNHSAGNALINVLAKSTEPGVFEAAANAFIELSPRLSTELNQRFRNTLIATLEKSHGRNKDNKLAVAGRLVVLLKSRFNLEETSRIHDAMSGILSQASYWDDLNAAGMVLEAIAPRIRQEERLRVAQTLMVKVLQKETSVAHLLVDYIRHVEPNEQKRILTATLLILFDLHGLSNSFYDDSYSKYDLSPFFPAIMAMNDSRSFALLLQHPACVGELRECMLQRFEELVLLDGQRMFLPMPSKSSQGDSQLASATSEPPPVRRFKTMHDAAEWIQQNWPDFDLDATHPVTFRGER